MADTTGQVSVQESVGGDDGERWSASRVWLIGWLAPARAARRSQHIALKVAYLWHLIGAAVFLVALWIMVAWVDARGVPTRFSEELADVVQDFLAAIERHPLEMSLAIVGTVVGVELGFVLLAAIFMSWGAGDEPARKSFAAALRWLWFLSMHFTVAMVICCSFIVKLENTGRLYSNQRQLLEPTRPVPPSAAPSSKDLSKEWMEYSEKMNRYHEIRQQFYDQWRANRPWIIKYGEEVLGYIFFGILTWYFWAILRGIGIRRDLPPVERPPTCERCGYNLLTLPMEARCPECGEPVVTSLGPDARPGTLWQRRHEVGRLHAGYRCAVDAVVRPQWFGRQLKTVHPGVDHRSFLFMHLPVIFVIAAIAILVCFYVDTGRNPFEHDMEVVSLVSPATGYFTASSMVAFVLMVAALIGLAYAWRQKRNLMNPAVQAGCYLAGYLVLWTLISGVIAIGAFGLEDFFENVQRSHHIDDEFLAFCFWALPNLVLLLLFLFLVHRITAAARYANR